MLFYNIIYKTSNKRKKQRIKAGGTHVGSARTGKCLHVFMQQPFFLSQFDN